ncbi:O-antigen ligase family protein [Alienimonas sp. DA493]|uniref:O-antigen ligase family protein n=1 Tax=Alienimonas sp. DA493 TaxID=3373605 RepID=UPI003754B82E
MAVVAAVMTAPWFFNSAASVQLSVASAGLALAAGGLTMWFGASRIPAALWPLAGALLLGASQAASPVFGDDLETATGELAPHLIPVSVARSETREMLALITLAVLTFLLAARAGGHGAGRRVVWWGLAGTVAAFAIAGLVGRLGLSTEYGLTSTGEEIAGLTGPFFAGMNRSHAAELLNLGLAAVLGLLAGGGGRGAAAACGAVIAAGLVVAGSRAGLAAVPVGLLLAGLASVFLSRRNTEDDEAGRTAAPFDLKNAGWVVAAGVVTVVVGTTVSLWHFDVEDTTLDRLEQSRNSTFEEQIAGRWAHWEDAFGVVEDLPLFGSGFGTHGYATRPYQAESTDKWFTHADNQYVETLVEGGAAGLALLAATAACLLWGVRRAGRAGAADAVIVAAYAAGAIAVHGTFDYGITRPPVLLAAAALLGAACGAGVPSGSRGGLGRFGAAAFVLTLAAAGGWAAREHWLAAPAAPHRGLDSVDGDAAAWPELAVGPEIDRLTEAVERRPDDVEARFALGRLLMRRYRDETAAALRAAPAAAGMSDRAIARLADPGFGAFAALGPNGAAQLAEMRADPLVRRTLAPAFEHLSAARAACPFLPRLDYHLARIAWAAPEEDPTGRRFLAALHRNNSMDVEAQGAAAYRAERLGLQDLADACWRAVLEGDPDRITAVVAAVSDAGALDEAERSRLRTWLPSDPAARAAAATAIAPKRPDLAEAIAKRVLMSDAAPRDRAAALRLTGDAAGAVAAMRTHLAAAARDLEARRTLIGWLIDDGELDAAAEQLALLVAVSPRDRDARRLADRLDRARREALKHGLP